MQGLHLELRKGNIIFIVAGIAETSPQVIYTKLNTRSF
jgi:hypothetical protein